MIDQIQALRDRNRAKAKAREEEDRRDLEAQRNAEAEDKIIDGRRFLGREGRYMKMAVSADLDQVGVTTWRKLSNEEARWLGSALIKAANHNDKIAREKR